MLDAAGLWDSWVPEFPYLAQLVHGTHHVTHRSKVVEFFGKENDDGLDLGKWEHRKTWKGEPSAARTCRHNLSSAMDLKTCVINDLHGIRLPSIPCTGGLGIYNIELQSASEPRTDAKSAIDTKERQTQLARTP